MHPSIEAKLAELPPETAAEIRRLEFMIYLSGECAIHRVKQLGSYWVGLKQFMFTWAIVGAPMYDRDSISLRWCYHSEADAVKAFEARDGTEEPTGWHRHPATGRRRNPDGSEYVVW